MLRDEACLQRASQWDQANAKGQSQSQIYRTNFNASIDIIGVVKVAP